MKRVMDLPRFGEAKLVRDRGQDFNDCEGSFTFRSELWVGDGAFEVSGFQPDFIAFDKRGESPVIA